MTAHAQFVRVGRLKGAGIIKRAARHNLREIAAEIGGYGGIDGRRVHLNQVLRGAAMAEEVAISAQSLLDSAGIKRPRKDAVLGVEVIVSLRPGSQVNQQAFFADSLAWVDGYFKVPVVSAVVHNDEAAPHLHVLIVPVVDGGLRGSDLIGSRYKLMDLQANFHEVVGKPHGLTYAKPRKHSKANPIGFECRESLNPIGFRAESEEEKTEAYLCVGFGQNPPIGLRQRKLEMLTWQFTVGIQQKLARGGQRWAH